MGGGGGGGFKVVLTQELEVSAIPNGGGRKKIPPFEKGGTNSFTLSWGEGGQQVSDPRFSHFAAPPACD